MISIQIITILVVLVAGYLAISKFNQYCFDRFDHAFFSKIGFYIVTIATLLFYYGSKWMQSFDKDIALNGIVLFVAGAVVSLFLIYRNIKDSNLMFGAFGSFLQLAIFGLIAYQSIPFLFLFLICIVIGGIPQPKINNIYHY
jgi:CDP-diglyceride synthetase